MTRTPGEWEKAGVTAVDEALMGAVETADRQRTEILSAESQVRDAVLGDDLDRTDKRTELRSLESRIVAAANELLDAAYEVRKLRSGSALRQLDGEEPLGYSKPDYGVTTDAYYGSKAMNANFDRRIGWVHDLDAWSKEEGGRPPGPNAELETVSAEGVVKYTRHIGGRRVHLVLGERDPPV